MKESGWESWNYAIEDRWEAQWPTLCLNAPPACFVLLVKDDDEGCKAAGCVPALGGVFPTRLVPARGFNPSLHRTTPKISRLRSPSLFSTLIDSGRSPIDGKLRRTAQGSLAILHLPIYQVFSCNFSDPRILATVTQTSQCTNSNRKSLALRSQKVHPGGNAHHCRQLVGTRYPRREIVSP
jgi:hypothetical protein